VRAFHFEKQLPTEIGFTNKGYLPRHNELDKTTLDSIAIGKGLGITSLQLISAFTCITNKGIMVKPLLAKGMYDHKGYRDNKMTKISAKKVITSKNAQYLKKAIENVIRDPQDKNPVGGIRSKMGLHITDDFKQTNLFKEGFNSYDTRINTYLGDFSAKGTEYVVLVTIHEPEKIEYDESIGGGYFQNHQTSHVKALEKEEHDQTR
jgi:stage V sporulation protein D (sporulation-specific penicillin-binding protein)